MARFSDYGLDDKKKAVDDPVLQKKFWCLWCNDSHIRFDGFNLCFQNWVICQNCVESSDMEWNRHRWEETDYCFKCKKPAKRAYSTHEELANKLHICDTCINWAADVLNINFLNKPHMEKTTELMMIPLKDVVPSPTNPRKTFDAIKTTELAESIREKGVLQPILVRMKGKKYEIVCGERRYRASQMVATLDKNKSTIPAVIRELSDQEVREMQLIENFQREDVSPMEEAIAIKYAVETGQYSFEELAHKVGKSLTYIKQRMKLNDLSEDFQALFFNGNMSMTTALKLSAFSLAVQGQILKDHVDFEDLMKNPKEKYEPGSYFLARFEGKLSEATFDLTDETIDPKAGACSKCPYNTTVSQLFPDDIEKARCTNINCFKNKTDVAFARELEAAKEDPTVILISTNYNSFDNKKLCADLIAVGHEVYTSNQWSALDKPDQPDWDEFKEYQDYDDASEEEQKDLLREFELQKSEYQKDLIEYQDRIAGGKFKKAFVVDGSNIGAYAYVQIHKNMPKGNVVGDKKLDPKSEKITVGDIDLEIGRIKSKETRSKQLDQNSIWETLRPQFNPHSNASMLKGEITPLEKKAIAVALSSKLEYSDTNGFEKLFKWKEGKNGYPDVDDQTFRQMLRYFMLSVLPPKVLYSGYEDRSDAKLSIEIAREYFPSVLKDIMDAQYEKTQKRIARIDKAIKDLQKKKKELAAKTTSKKRSGKSAAANDDTQDEE